MCFKFIYMCKEVFIVFVLLNNLLLNVVDFSTWASNGNSIIYYTGIDFHKFEFNFILIKLDTLIIVTDCWRGTGHKMAYYVYTNAPQPIVSISVS